ncbi:MAG: putative sulfate exporter family transporter [Acidobacteria bacterium]|nr:putative sulfate exporter family transporter [Acidobacteriota bacterium]
MGIQRAIFLAAAALSLTPWIGPPAALVIGLALGLGGIHPYRTAIKRLTRVLLQTSVVLLGFGMNLHQVVRAGRSGFLYTSLGIAFAMLVGYVLGRVLNVERTAAFLISSGTAICGGSAIAALGPISGANDEEMSISLGTIFVLNSVALLTFPRIGALLRLSQEQFGLWAALAIHDTSSVVGAATKYGAVALAVGTTVKLARALWIVPMALATAMVKGSRVRVQYPWFILFFVLAAVAATYVPLPPAAFKGAAHIGVVGLTLTLFLIGSNISRPMLRQVGARPLLQGIFLWLAVAAVSLWMIQQGLVRL